MKARFLIHNAIIVNEGKRFPGYVSIQDGRIHEVGAGPVANPADYQSSDYEVIDAGGAFLLPGVIDDQVHFREPGLTHKADMYTESRAAVAGGVTSFMDMPNTIPQTTTIPLLKEKQELAAQKSLANYSFFLGATNENTGELCQADPATIPGIKVFMGASTGNMLVDDDAVLETIFSKVPLLIAIHSESERIIQENLSEYKELYGDDIPVYLHPLIRSTRACLTSTQKALDLARKHGTRLHVLHVSTAAEMALFEDCALSPEKKITSEVCVHHLWFDDRDYERLGTRIKWNPAIKTPDDREALLKGVAGFRADVVATDHAPHTLGEKDRVYTQCPSGAPAVQHSLPLMVELSLQGHFPLETVVQKMSHNVALCFGIEKRGFIRPGYFADLVLLRQVDPRPVTIHELQYKCGWSPWEGVSLRSEVSHTFVNGNLVYQEGTFHEAHKGQALTYCRK